MSDQTQVNDIAFIKHKFAHYYRNAEFQPPERLSKREFGFFYFESPSMQRPVAFSNKEMLVRFLIERTPMHVYYSAAYYEDPSVPMAQKKWLGSDLIFDLDADHIEGAESLDYEQQLAKVKERFIYLIEEFIAKDLFDYSDMNIVFSGGRGYHLHVRNRKILQLGPHERREIVDYISGRGLEANDWEWIFPKKKLSIKTFQHHVSGQYITQMPTPSQKGWRGRMARGIIENLNRWEGMFKDEVINEFLKFKGLGKTRAERIYSDLFSIHGGVRGIDKIKNDYNIEIFSDQRNLNAFLGIVREMVRVEVEGETDEPVTSDIKRLIRLPGSLHGKTGLVVTPVPFDKMKDFDPLRDAFPPQFTDKAIRVRVKKPISIKLKDECFKLKEGPTELPEFAAIFMLCRGMSTLEPT